MAPVSCVLRTCGILLYLILQVHATRNLTVEPWIVSLKVEAKSCVDVRCKYLLLVNGTEFLGHYSWKLTSTAAARGSYCDNIYSDYEINEVKTTEFFTRVRLALPNYVDKIFFCLRHSVKEYTPVGGTWVHQGADLFLEPKTDASDADNSNKMLETEIQQQVQSRGDLQESSTDWADLSHDTDVNYLPNPPRLTREEENDIEMYINDKYVPISNIKDVYSAEVLNYNHDTNEIQDVESMDRKKRETIKNVNFENPNDFKSKIRKNNLVDTNNAENLNYSIKKNAVQDKSHDENQSESTYGIFTNGNNINENYNIYDGVHHMLNIVDNTVIRKKREIIKDINDLKGDDKSIDVIPKDDKNDESKKPIIAHAQISDLGDLGDSPRVRASWGPVAIEGLRVEDSDKETSIIEDGIPDVFADTKVVLRLFGEGLTPRTVITFSHDVLPPGQPCKFMLKAEYMAKEGSVTATSALFEIIAPPPLTDNKFYICAKNLKPGVDAPENDQGEYLHQGTEHWKMFATHKKMLPLWASLILILICLSFSALFSGLNLGLMSLDRTELKIISNTGTEQERNYARAIMPVRDHGNYLLCSILLGNVAVNSTFTILLDDLTSGLFAVIFSTLAIVLLGEITPQAICSRHGLMVGAKSIMITKAVMALTAPLAFPVSKLLDYFLGEEIGSVYNRERLKELVKVTTDVNDLDKDEVNIISGALELRKKTVSDVMTKLEDVFMLPITSVLDFETMSEIVKSGYSRIPVHEGGRTNIVTVLFIKDLAFVDPDDNTPLRTLCQYYQNPCNFVFEDVTLDVMFKQFKEGHKGHMAFVHRINNEGEGDPFYETIGLVTLEDVIEEMIQAEIIDETDVFMDNRSKRRRNRPQHKLQDFAAFAERHENQRIHISPQLTLATFQFLSTSVDAFKPDTVSETVLRRLLRQDVIQYIKLKGKAKREPSTYVFQQGKPVDYFVLILEGRVEVTVGRENLVFEAGPFTYFGSQALTQNVGVAESPTPSAMGSLQNINMEAMLRHTFVPDYSVRAVTDVYYLTVKRSLYLAAKRATLMEKGALSKGATNEQFDTEVDKLLESVDEDISISGDHKTPSRQVSPNPPTSASPLTRASFASRASPERNGELYAARADEQEKLLKH
ncbi:unextended protein [Bicyclus anynana]|uniref:Unextended protein n=1 Tax=Bicyclus anynana TaxID=110368 RepID=A0ABM3M1R8_BICAN|nr:unextended protein [Bicyclus anynana]